jgi:subtilisin family serine protease
MQTRIVWLALALPLIACGQQSARSLPSRSSAAQSDVTALDQHVFLFNDIPSDFAQQVTAAGGQVVRTHPAIGVAVASGLSDAAAKKIANGNSFDRDVQVRWTPSAADAQASVFAQTAQPDSLKPPQTAAFLPLQWNMRQIHAVEAWTGHTGIPSVRVAIVDTGLDAFHIDLAGLIDTASSMAFEPSTRGPPAWEDDNFHGSHVGGIVTSNNIGVAGVAPNVTLIAVKVLNASGSGSFANVIAGILWATDVGANVINMSLGAYVSRQQDAQHLDAALQRAINYANSHGVFVAIAAGNSHIDLQHDSQGISVPCELGVNMCVSATSDLDTLASYSNYGTNAIDVGAPGGDADAPPISFVLSVCSSRATEPGLEACDGAVGTHYAFAAGTSMASPHVAGTAAFVDSQFGGTLEPSQIRTIIDQTADVIDGSGASPFFGHGRINTLRAVSDPTP